ncbi:hypothetical protein K9M79_00020 [Candidatus Woesearchaeota archaeon]|nr:hypothetical protein [Candidatus Woesearchaeota archaeon]
MARVRVKSDRERDSMPHSKDVNDNPENDKTESKESKDVADDKAKRPSSIRIFTYIVFLMIILIGSVFVINYYFSQDSTITPDDSYHYDTYKFDRIGNYWYTDLIFSTNDSKLVNLEMRYDPKSLLDIEVDPDLYDHFVKTQGFIITADPTLSGVTAISMMHLNRIIGKEFGLFNYPTFAAITDDHPGMGDDTPVFDCENATPQYKVIWLGVGNDTEVTYNNNCIKVSGSNETEILRSTDRFLYEAMGIMNASETPTIEVP